MGGKIFRSRLSGERCRSRFRKTLKKTASGFERASWGTVREFRTVVGEGTSFGIGLGCRARPVLHPFNQPRRRESMVEYQKIQNAIRQRHVVTFRYHGFARTVVPCACGLSSAGNLVFRGCQTAGGSNSGRTVPFWSLFLVSEVTDFLDSGIRFAVVPNGYKRGDKGIERIDVEL